MKKLASVFAIALFPFLLQGCAGAGSAIGGLVAGGMTPAAKVDSEGKIDVQWPEEVLAAHQKFTQLHTQLDLPVTVITTGFKPMYDMTSRNSNKGCGGSLMFKDTYPFSGHRFKAMEDYLRREMLYRFRSVSYGKNDKTGDKVNYLICIDYDSPRAWGEACENYSFNYRFYVMASSADAVFPNRKGNTCSLTDYDPTGTGSDLIYASELKNASGKLSDVKLTSNKDGEISKDEGEYYAENAAYYRATINMATDPKLHSALADYISVRQASSLPTVSTEVAAECKTLGFSKDRPGYEKCLKTLSR